MRKRKFYFALSENHYKSIKEFMCAALSCSLETRFMPSTETTSRPESASLDEPPRTVRKSLLAAFTLSNSSSSSSSSKDIKKDIKKENPSPLKRAKIMQEDETEVLSGEDHKKAMAKQIILQQFRDLLQNSPPTIMASKSPSVELDRLQRRKPAIFAKFNTHANLLMKGRHQGRFAEHGYLASEHSLVTKAPFYHANHVVKDLAAEAPNSATTEIFWGMVLQHEMDGVVMLTQFGPGQCFDYCSGTFGVFKVRCIDQSSLYSEGESPLIIRRTLEIQQQAEERIVKKEIHHIQVLNWLDDEALPTPSFKALLDITRHYGKLVAHCIAGLGRTGTFLAARMVYPRIRTESLATVIPACANSVREARPGSIRNYDQFRSIYDVMKSIKENHVIKPEEEKTEFKK